LYFYHPDHLGSTSIITDRNGIATQFVAYLPFGEQFVDEHTSSWESQYKFNGKEIDQETGLIYVGARYYDPKTSVWYGVDPLAGKYPNVGGYVYCGNNPIWFVDRDGRFFTSYMNEYGELLYQTNDGLTNIIIINDASIATLTQKLNEANINGNIDEGDYNKKELHKLGTDINNYPNSFETMNGDLNVGLKAGYTDGYKRKGSIFKTIFYMIIMPIVAGEDATGGKISAGYYSGKQEGKSDKKANKINKLDPYSSIKKGEPLIKLPKQSEVSSSETTKNNSDKKTQPKKDVKP
jgi:RHS repeat-associated protein